MATILTHPTTTATTSAAVEPDERTRTVERPAAVEATARPPRTLERAFILGFYVGTPIVFAVTFTIGLLGGAGFGPSILIGLWTGMLMGWYLGGIAFLPGTRQRETGRPRR